MTLENSFQRWADDYGLDRLARDLGATLRVVRKWKRREGWPKVENIIRICELSGGKLDANMIIRSTAPVGSEKRLKCLK